MTVDKKPLQRDLFTGELVKPPKRGDGHHIKLKREGRERAAVPGMASYAGEGPYGRFCRDCHWYGTIRLTRPDLDTVENAIGACALWAQRMGHATPTVKSDISLCNSCALFKEPTSEARIFAIDPAGSMALLRF
jgi:hypothetical protein